MSKRRQEGNPGRVSAMSKPKSMNLVMAKIRPANLVPQNALSTKRSSQQELSDSNYPGNAQTGQGSVSTGFWKQRRDIVQNPAEHCLVRKQESTQMAESWPQENKSESSHSTGVWKQTRGVDSHMNRSETEFRNMKIPKRHYTENVYHYLQKKLGTRENLSKFGPDSMKTNVLMWGLFMSSSIKLPSSCTEVCREPHGAKEHEFQGDSESVWCR